MSILSRAAFFLFLSSCASLSVGCSSQADETSQTSAPEGDGNVEEKSFAHCEGKSAFKCVEDQLYACDEETGEYALRETCENARCNDIEGYCGVCAPGASNTCIGTNAHLVCDASGREWQQLPCGPDAPFCAGAGACVECLQDSDCPTSTQDCRVAACIKNTCTTVVTAGAVLAEQPSGDCKQRICGADGDVIEIPALEDLPPDNGEECLIAQCSADGDPLYVAKEVGTQCSKGVCNAQETCTTCLPGSHRCVGERYEQLCNELGEWDTAYPCSEERPLCGASDTCVGIIKVKTGINHSCALFEDGHLRCWGSNEEGQIGNGSNGFQQYVETPTPVVGLPDKVDDFALGEYHTCARIGTTLWCWGNNGFRQLMVPVDQMLESPHPVQVNTDGKPVLAISAKYFSTCYITKADEGAPAELNCNTSQSERELVHTGDFSDVACGRYVNCVISKGGQAACAGANDSGQLGIGSSVSSDTSWTPLKTQITVDALSLGDAHALSLSKTSAEKGLVWAWGQGAQGQLMRSETSTSSNSVPFPIGFFDGEARAIAAGSMFSCIVSPYGALFCSGKNDRGQLALGYSYDKHPFSYGISYAEPNFVQVDAGGKHACGLTQTGIVLCWGAGTEGQIGDGKRDDRSSPTKVVWLYIFCLRPIDTRSLVMMMRSSLALLLLTASSLSFALNGCADEAFRDDTPEATAGNGGSAGVGGEGGSAGSPETAGSGGESGSAGSNGESGAAGDGGSAGSGASGASGAAGSGSAPTCSPDTSPDADHGVFVSPNGSDDSDGSLLAPLASIAKALSLAAASGKSRVYLASGTYSGPLSIPAGISIEGGWTVSDGSWHRDCSPDARTSTVLTADAFNTPVILVDHIDAPSSLDTLTIKTKEQGESHADQSGESLIGVLVRGKGVSFSLTNVEIVAGKAGDGGVASPGQAGEPLACDGLTDCATGEDGADGNDGTAPSKAGAFTSDGFVPADGLPGKDGHDGKNGMAGELGQSSTCAKCYGNDKSSCQTSVPQSIQISATNGKCGCAGSGGLGGSAGRGGGASVALLVSEESHVIGNQLLLHAQQGGHGTPGAIRNDGASGNDGAQGSNSSLCELYQQEITCAWSDPNNQCTVLGTTTVIAQGGAAGGKGGKGGSGGKGGPGAGGSSFAVVMVTGGEVSLMDSTLSHGEPGSGAEGAPSGDAADIGPL